MRLEDAVHREPFIDRSEDKIYVTSIHLPRWLRATVTILHDSYQISEDKLFTVLVNHGSTILKDRYGDAIKSYIEVHDIILDAKNTVIEAIATDYAVEIDGLAKQGKQRSIRMPTWCKGFLGSFGRISGMSYASLIRLAMYLSLNTHDILNKERKEICKNEIEIFERKFEDYIEVCQVLSEHICKHSNE